MRTKIFTLGMAALTAIFMMAAPLQAQTKAQKKAAKKEAKTLASEGWKTMQEPIELQLANFYAEKSQKGDDGMPKYVTSTGKVTAQTFSAARMSAIAAAKADLTRQIRAVVEVTVQNDVRVKEELKASATQFIGNSVETAMSSLGRTIVAQEMYREKDGMTEVRVAIFYDTKTMREMLRKEASQALFDEMDRESASSIDLEAILDAIDWSML